MLFLRLSGDAAEGTGELSLYNIALNALIVPNNVTILVGPPAIYLTPTWSLGLELTFYCVFPLILIGKARLCLLVGSAAFFLLPYLGVLNTDNWGYRLLPGTLFIFLTGSYLFSNQRRTIPWVPCAVWLFAAVLLSGTWLWPLLHALYNREVLAGILFGIPAVWLLRHQPSGWLDRTAGNLSYGVFLNHIVLIWGAHVAGVRSFNVVHLCLLFTTSMILAAVTYQWIERPLLAWRHRWLRGTRRDSSVLAAVRT